MHRLHCYNVMNTASSPVVPSLHMWKRLQSLCTTFWVQLTRHLGAPGTACKCLSWPEGCTSF